uniref:DNA excision repair protein ERCC-1 n=1 Tax=Kalanchoe fedtschenkoi TaxID=63787 RepID=A0A7N0V5Z3_KALFE
MEGESGGANLDSRDDVAAASGSGSGQKTIIQIPSYQDVLQNTQAKSASAATQLFKPSASFSEAFSFVKGSEFYKPPPTPDVSISAQSGLLDTSSTSAPAMPQSSAVQSTQYRNAILVSNRQKGNPLLKYIRNVRWNFAEIMCDYLLGQSTCALYLSLRYHLLHPDYLYYRIRELQKNFKLRIILCHVDVEDVVKPLLEVTRTALLHDCTLLCAWSLEECGRYLETIKVYEKKPADLIQGQMDTDYISRISHALTSIRHVNKTDVVTLGSTFGSLSHIMDASMEDLARCPGIGERKVKRLYDTFHEPFRRAVPVFPTAPENAKDKKVLEMEGSEEESSSHSKKEKEDVVKSALSAAFAKYAEKNEKSGNKKPKLSDDESDFKSFSERTKNTKNKPSDHGS